jgi:hypothetical protein
MARGLHRANDMQLPGLFIARLVTQTLERNRELDLVAGLRQSPLRLPHVVGRQVRVLARPHGSTENSAARCTSPRLDQHAIALNAQRIHGEHERLPAVAVRAEEQLHVVVLRDAVAVGQRGAYGAGRREGANAHMQGRR